jgi:hypothetical protein
MENVVYLFGLPTTVLDFTDDLSLLLAGLITLVWLSAGMIAWAAVRHYWSEKTKTAPRTTPVSADHRDAA